MVATQAPERTLLKSSTIMAFGTLASRITGFLRTAVLAFALGTSALADIYNTANTIPKGITDLLLGGILTSVVVPMIVSAKRQDADQGYAYEQRLFTLVTLLLFVLTVVAVLLAGPLISLYAQGYTEVQHDLAVVLARFLLPQIFFVGMSAFVQAILNTRNHFAAPMWAPVLNNLVIIAVGLTFFVITHNGVSPGTITAAETQLLGIGTTVGLVIQTIVLLPALRSVGFRWRPRFDFGQAKLGEMGRMASWMFCYVLATQTALVVTANFANLAGRMADAAGVPYGAGFTPYLYAYMLFQLPYAIIAVSVFTALLPRMSEYASEERYDLVRENFSNGIRLSAAAIVPVAVLFFALAPAITVLIFAHLRTGVADAVYIGYVLRTFAIGLVPFSAFQLLLRVFYALKDTRTPALLGAVNVVVNIGINTAVFYLLPAKWITVGLATGLWVSQGVGLVVGWLLLRRRFGGLDGRQIAQTVGRLFLAATPALVFAYAMLFAFTGTFGYGTVTTLLAVVTGTGIGGMMYLLLARRLGITDVTSLVDMVRSRVGRS